MQADSRNLSHQLPFGTSYKKVSTKVSTAPRLRNCDAIRRLLLWDELAVSHQLALLHPIQVSYQAVPRSELKARSLRQLMQYITTLRKRPAGRTRLSDPVA